MNQVVDKALRGMALLRVSNIRHWTDRTFSFNCERPQGFRFRSGEFVMIGLMVEGKPLVRAYSIASPVLGRRARVLLDQGAGRPADLAPAAPRGRRRDRDAAEAGRHAGARRAPARQAAVPLRHRHRHRALRLDRPRSGDLREVRAGGADPHLPRRGRARLRPRPDGADPRRRDARRDGRRQAALHLHHHPRDLARHGPDDRLDPRRPPGRGHRRRRSIRRPTG